MPNQWTIHHAEGDPDKSDLIGCHIIVNGDGTAYQFTESNVNNILSTTEGTTLPTPPFDFPNFPYDGHNWDLTVTTLTGGHSGNKAEGTWSNDDSQITNAQDGTYTAQAGSTVDEDPGESSTAAKA